MKARTFWQFLLSSARRGAPLGEVRKAVLGTAAFAASVPGLASGARRRASVIGREYQKARAVVRAAPFRRYREQLERLGEIRFSGARGPSAVLAWRAHLYSAHLVGDARRGEYVVSVGTLARRALMTPPTMRVWTRAFTRAGWIARLRAGRKGGGVSIYKINLHRPPLAAILAAGDARLESEEGGRNRPGVSDEIFHIRESTLKAFALVALSEEKQGVRGLPDAGAEGRGAASAPRLSLRSLVNIEDFVRAASPSSRPPRRRPAYPPLSRRVGPTLRVFSRDDDDARKTAEPCLLPAFGKRVPLEAVHPVWRRFPGHLPFLLWTYLSETDAWTIARFSVSDQRRLRRALGALRDAGLAKQTSSGGWLKIEHVDLDELARTLGHLAAIRSPRKVKEI